MTHEPTRVLVPAAPPGLPSGELLFTWNGVDADYVACSVCTVHHPVLGVVPMPWRDAVRDGHPGPVAD